MDMYIFMMYIFLYDFFFVIHLIFFFYPTQKLNRISLLFTASASQQFENYSLFLKKYQIHEKTKKKKFSRQNQIEIFTYYYKLQPLKFFFLCVTGTLLYVMDISVFVFNQKNQKLKKMDISVSRFV